MITFGPVPSRRLGRSLGINNIVTPKKCSYSCIYCQVGKTSRPSAKREEFFSPKAIAKAVNSHLKLLKEEDMPDEIIVLPPDESTLNLAWHIFSNTGVETELLTGFEGTGAGSTGNIYEDILNITAVHPLREDSIKELLKRDNADERVLKSLLAQRLIKMVRYKDKNYFIRQLNQ